MHSPVDYEFPMREKVRIVGRDYVRRHGDETSRALVEELERENALLRMRATVLLERDVRHELAHFGREFRWGLLLSITGIALIFGLTFVRNSLLDPYFHTVNVTLEYVGDKVILVSFPEENGL